MRVERLQLGSDGGVPRVGMVLMNPEATCQIILWKPDGVKVEVGDEVEVDIRFAEPAASLN